jgi:hypothetical protein
MEQLVHLALSTQRCSCPRPVTDRDHHVMRPPLHGLLTGLLTGLSHELSNGLSDTLLRPVRDTIETWHSCVYLDRTALGRTSFLLSSLGPAWLMQSDASDCTLIAPDYFLQSGLNLILAYNHDCNNKLKIKHFAIPHMSTPRFCPMHDNMCNLFWAIL